MRRFRNWTATFGALALGIVALTAAAAPPTAGTTTPFSSETRDRALGTIDVTSGGLGLGAAAVPPVEMESTSIASDGITLSSGYDRPDVRHQIAVNPYTREHRKLGPPVPRPVTDTLEIVGRNIASIVVDVARAGVTCDVKLDVASDGPLSVTLLGCGGAPQTFG